MITLIPLSTTHQDELSYVLDDEQMQFTALPQDWLNDERADAYKAVILDDELHRVVGFLCWILDRINTATPTIPKPSCFALCP